MKKKIKKDIKDYDQMQKELEKYKGKNISYDNFQNKIEESEEIEENEMEDISEDKNDKEENNNAKPNILNMNYNKNNSYNKQIIGKSVTSYEIESDNPNIESNNYNINQKKDQGDN